MKILFSDQAIKCELVVTMLEKWGLHPKMEEISPTPDLDDLERAARVLIPDQELERAKEILWGESEFDRAEF
jgi:hypothetical protein